MSERSTLRKMAFSRIKGLNVGLARQLLALVGSTDAFFEMPEGELSRTIDAKQPFYTDVERQRLLRLAEAEYEFTTKSVVRQLFYTDADYPKRLAMCDDAPVMVYVLGSCNLNAAHCISVVGTRNATSYGAEMTKRIVCDLAKILDNVIIISGLAYGIDVCSHRAALDANIPTVGVVAHGLNTMYPAEHRNVAARMVHSGGCLVSEYTSSDQMHRSNFLARNRIIAALADVTLVVESDDHGGALVTAGLASAYNREVCAVPGRCTDRYSRGCNNLITSNRATMVRNGNDIVELMQWTPRADVTAEPVLAVTFDRLSPQQQVIINHLRSNPTHTLNDMVHSLGIAYPELSARVMEMEMEDILTALPGGTFNLKV